MSAFSALFLGAKPKKMSVGIFPPKEMFVLPFIIVVVVLLGS